MPLVNSFFEVLNRNEFSFLNLSLFSVSLTKPLGGGWLAGTENERMDVWLGETAYFHEIRHYHDLIGSVSGFHIFLEATELVDKFFSILQKRKTDIPLPLDLTSLDAAAGELYAGYRKFFSTIFGDEPVEIEIKSPRTRKYPIRHFRSEKPNLNTYYPLVPIPRLNPHTGLSEVRLVPVGFRSLLEHVATDMQFYLASGAASPKDFVDEEELSGRQRRDFNTWRKLYRSDFLPYIVVKTFGSYCVQMT